MTEQRDRLADLAEAIASTGCIVVACLPADVGDALRVARYGAVLVLADVDPANRERVHREHATAVDQHGEIVDGIASDALLDQSALARHALHLLDASRTRVRRGVGAVLMVLGTVADLLVASAPLV